MGIREPFQGDPRISSMLSTCGGEPPAPPRNEALDGKQEGYCLTTSAAPPDCASPPSPSRRVEKDFYACFRFFMQTFPLIMRILLLAIVLSPLLAKCAAADTLPASNPKSPGGCCAPMSAPPSEQAWTVKEWLQTGGLVLTSISIFLVVVGLRTSQKALQQRVALDALTLLEGKDAETWENWLLLEDVVQQAEGDPERFKRLASLGDRPKKFRRLARAFDVAGLLAKNRLIPVDLLFQFYSRPIAISWKYLRYISEDKAARPFVGQLGHMMLFEILAAGAVMERERVGLDNASRAPETEAEQAWTVWNRYAWRLRKRQYRKYFEAERPLRELRTRRAKIAQTERPIHW